MKPRGWDRVEDLFEAAVDLDSAARDALIEHECGGDEQLERELRSLIDADRLGWSTFDDPPISEAMELLRQRETAGLIGSRAGPYRLLSELGHGGMGTVYLAERADHEYRQQVALKVMRMGCESDQAVERFRRERQFLARLRHPHIACLLDGGTMEDGLPYLVMEHIEGEPIDEYCERRRLSIRQRLDLLLLVGEAVQFAHSQLIIHRDLKPSNVMVTAGGVPKLLDFGIAKLLDSDRDLADGSRTATDLRALTPRYASPEQLTGGAVTTATDVYGLGLLLYELLTGRPAHRMSGRRALDAARMICEMEPTRPSQAVGEAADDDVPGADEVSRARATSTGRLRRNLRGDLDNITLKALRKEPERRYASVEQLCVDLRRHLKGLPVSAQPDRWSYRATKFVRRHAAGVAMSTALVSVVMAATTMVVVQAQQAEQERDRAEFERGRAEEVSGFLVDLLGLAVPGSAEGRQLPIDELVEMGADRIRREYAAEPEIQATLLTALGVSYQKMGSYDRAESLLLEALGIRSSALGDDHLETASSRFHLGRLYVDMRRPDDARVHFEEAVETRREKLGEAHPEYANALGGIADTLLLGGDYAAAETLGRTALAIHEAASAADSSALAWAYHDLGNVLRLRGEHAEAIAMLEQSLELGIRELPPGHADLGTFHHDLGAVYRHVGRFDEARSHLGRSLTIYQEALGADHPHVAASLESLGSLFSALGEPRRAEDYLRRAIQVNEASNGPHHPSVGVSYHNLAHALFKSGDYARAQPLFERALTTIETSLGAEHPFASFSLHFLGAIARLRGELEQAEQLLGRSLDMRLRSLPAEHYAVGSSKYELGLLRRDQGRPAEAERLLREALVIREAAYGDVHLEVAAVLYSLAELCYRTGRTEEGRRLVDRTVAIRRGRLGDEHPDTRAAVELVSLLSASASAAGS